MAAAVDPTTRIDQLFTQYESGIRSGTCRFVSGGDAVYGSFSGAYNTLHVESTGGSLHYLPGAYLSGRTVELHALYKIIFDDLVHLAAFDALTITTHELVMGALQLEGNPEKVSVTCSKITFVVKQGQGETPAQRFFREHAPKGVQIETKTVA